MQQKMTWKQQEFCLRKKPITLALSIASSQRKSIKSSFYYEKKKSIPLHNLISIAKELNAPEKIVGACKRLNPHYIQTRYPDAANAIPKDAYDEGIAEELLERAKEVFEWSEKQTEK